MIRIACGFGLFGFGLLLLASSAAHAQTSGPTQFEVATIKPAAPSPTGQMRIGIGIQPGGRFTAQGVTLKFLIAQAYDIKEHQISGGPGWMGSDQWDITAKADAAEMTGPIRQEQLRAMLQALLADRFKLTFHQDSKEMPIYALVVGKGGPKLQKSEAAGNQQRMMRFGNGQLNANGVPAQFLADTLSRQLGRSVIDKTGLQGLYDFKLEWTPDEGQRHMMPGGGALGADAPPPPDASGPSLFTAVQEQLGLRLDSEKGPVAMYLIDRAEKPAEN
jgi:bla regulator protein BlaR1